MNTLEADHPIRTLGEDDLGRRGFAERLAENIREWKGRGSLTIAIYGPWGSGKSSLKNMILDALRKHHTVQPIIEYNPWEWSGQDKLAEGFFKKLSEQFGRRDAGEVAEELAEVIDVWASRLGLFNVAPRDTRAILGIAAVIIGILGSSTLLGEVGWLQEYRSFYEPLKLIVAIIALFCLILWLLTAGLERFADLHRKKARLHHKSLSEIKAEVGKLLGSIAKPTLIVIDDIDRLTVDQIRMVFQLVKANADFENVTFLLLFDRDIVEKSLTEPQHGINGRDYLEKIVQIGYDIPEIDPAYLLNYFDEQITEQISAVAAELKHVPNFERARHTQLLLHYYKPYLQTLRNVRRILATMPFHFRLYKAEGRLEVNLVDLIALEILRVFEPNVYDYVAKHKQDFAPDTYWMPQESSWRERISEHIDTALKEVREPQSKSARRLLEQLFPVVAWTSRTGDSYSAPLEEWFGNKRVCHPDIFDRYFRRTLAARDVIQVHVDDIMAKSNDGPALRALLQDHVSKDRIKSVLVILSQVVEQYPPNDPAPLMTALFDVGDSLSNDRARAFEASPQETARRIIESLLENEKDINEKGALLVQTVTDTTGLYLPTLFVNQVDQANKERIQVDANAPIYLQNDIDTSKAECVNKILKAA